MRYFLKSIPILFKLAPYALLVAGLLLGARQLELMESAPSGKAAMGPQAASSSKVAQAAVEIAGKISGGQVSRLDAASGLRDAQPGEAAGKPVELGDGDLGPPTPVDVKAVAMAALGSIDIASNLESGKALPAASEAGAVSPETGVETNAAGTAAKPASPPPPPAKPRPWVRWVWSVVGFVGCLVLLVMLPKIARRFIEEE